MPGQPLALPSDMAAVLVLCVTLPRDLRRVLGSHCIQREGGKNTNKPKSIRSSLKVLSASRTGRGQSLSQWPTTLKCFKQNRVGEGVLL